MEFENVVFDEHNCPVTASMAVLGGKWKLILIHVITLTSPARFGTLRKNIKGISKTVLTTQLRELENDGLISRKVYAEIPPKVEYTLTALGHTLLPIIGQLSQWGYSNFIKPLNDDKFDENTLENV